MCGILAIVNEEAPIDGEVIQSALASLEHRGPDEQHWWRSPDERIALGHTRLSIVDLETGSQPMSNEAETLHLVANGEFYDDARIRSELESRGHRLRSRSDSEIALPLYEEKGEACLEQLRGEFAFAIYDQVSGELFAARDRFGIKPLFYALRPGGIVLASEVRALFAAGVSARWDESGMFQALHFAPTPEATLFAGVRQVPPGHFLRYRRGRVSLHRYWDTHYPRRGAQRVAVSEDEVRESVRREVEEAIRLRTRADVPIGCYLSGGIDSSAVLGMAREMMGRNVPAFSVSFDHPDFDERGPASEMAAFAGVDFHPVRVTSRDFAGAFEAAVSHGETPHYNGHGTARFLLSRAVREAGIKVVLGGEGADEGFGGYRFAQGALAARSRSLGGMAWRFLRPPDSGSKNLASFSPLLARLAGALDFPPALRERLEGHLGPYQALLDRDFLDRFRGRDPFRVLFRQHRIGELAGREAYKVIMPLWLKSHFANYVLAGERLDMAHAVEVRLPFLDHHLFECLRDLPSAHLVRGGENKHLLRRIAKPYVCRTVLENPKKPFFAPPGSGDDALHELFQDLLRSESFASLPFFDPGAVRAMLDRLPGMSAPEHVAVQPILFLLASLAVLQRQVHP